MAKKKETKKVELKEVSRVEINGNIIITYEDGSVKIIPAPIMLTADQAAKPKAKGKTQPTKQTGTKKSVARSIGDVIRGGGLF